MTYPPNQSHPTDPAPGPAAATPAAPAATTPAPTAAAKAKWVVPVIATGAVLLAAAITVLILILTRSDISVIPPYTPDPTPAATAEPTPQETPDPTPDPSAAPTAEPSRPEATADLDITITPAASWSVGFDDQFPDGAWIELVTAPHQHEERFNQVVALVNFNHLIALDEITGRTLWELPLAGEVTAGGCTALAKDDILACPIGGATENSGYVLAIDLTTGSEIGRSAQLPYTPTGIELVEGDYLVSGFSSAQWDEDFNDGVGGLPIQVHIRRGALPQIAEQPTWEAIGETTTLLPSELWTGSAHNDALVAAFTNEAQLVADLGTGNILWDSTTVPTEGDQRPTVGLTSDSGYYVNLNRHVSVHNQDNTLRFARPITGWFANHVGPQHMLAGEGVYDSQTGELRYEFTPAFENYWAGNDLGISVAPLGSQSFDVTTGEVLWSPPFVIPYVSESWIIADHYLTSTFDSGRLAAYDLHTGERRWNIQLSAAERAQPISTHALLPVRTANTHSWVAGEESHVIHAIVLGGYGEGWSLTNDPES